MKRSQPLTIPSPLLRWAIRRARAGETDSKVIIIIVVAVLAVLLLIGCGVFAFFALAVGSLTLPAVQQARQAAEATQSRNNLKMIGLGLHNYHDTFRQFPPGGIYGEDGTAYHSWQTMLLPYVDMAPLYNSIDFDVPWTDPVNTGHFQYPVEVFLRPGVAERADAEGFAVSHYAGSSQIFVPNGQVKLSTITDGTSNTILVGEVAAGFKRWGDPTNVRDPADGLLHDANTFGAVNLERGTVDFLLGDGSVRAISTNIDPDVLKALATPDGGEQIPPGSF
jgi:hypothetical protein